MPGKTKKLTGSLLLITEQMPKLIEEQVKAISNLNIDQITVWEGGRKGDGKTSTAQKASKSGGRRSIRRSVV